MNSKGAVILNVSCAMKQIKLTKRTGVSSMKGKSKVASTTQETSSMKKESWRAYCQKILIEHFGAQEMKTGKDSDYVFTFTEHNLFILAPRKGKEPRKVTIIH